MKNYKTNILLIITALLLAASPSFAREWTATSGHKLTGDFVKCDNGAVSIKLPNGKFAEVPFDKLCDTDKEFVRKETDKANNPFTIIEDKPLTQQSDKPKIGKDTPLELLKAEAGKNNPDALCWLSIAYTCGLNICQIDRTRVPKLRQEAAKFADEGIASAQFCRGVCYFCGYGVDVAPAEAVKWFRLAANQNFAPAQEWLGMCLLRGTGIKENQHEAIVLIRKAAEQDFAPAQGTLAERYNIGSGVDKNEKEALKWYQKAADNGDVLAQRYIGTAYLIGLIGLEKKLDEAMNWFNKAAKQGDKEAENLLKMLDAFNDKNKESIQNNKKP
ncbi:MAG: hypothetical protein LBT09_00385 [Planctomycetaceae bacterium]|jgi:TPR repeat protein|nr:hypothetical protein [Planctomycetaceae bacterium]